MLLLSASPSLSAVLEALFLTGLPPFHVMVLHMLHQ